MTLRDTWATPPDFYRWVDDRWHPTLDICASPENAKCERFITLEENAFKQIWPPARVTWCNPPGSEVKEWVALCAERAKWDERIVLCLVQAGVGSRWFNEFHKQANTYLLTPRVQFTPPKGVKRSSNARDYMLMEFGPNASGHIWVCKWK